MKDKGLNIDQIRKTISNQIRCINLIDISDNINMFVNIEEEWWYEDYCILYENVDYKDYDIGFKIVLDKEKMYNNFIYTKFVVDKLKDIVPQIMFFDNNIHIFFERDVEFNDYYYLNDIILSDLKKTHICGIEGINDFFYQKDEDDNWFVTSDGSNINELFKLDFVDIFNTSCNEFLHVVSSDGTYINERHVKLLVDVMTQHGMISSISRYGMKKDNSGPIAKASFEQSLDNFVKASFFSEKERLNGVSSNIMCGKKTNIGTNMCNLLQDLTSLGDLNMNTQLSV